MTSKKFQELYKSLNPRQREAVDTIEGPVMVIAGPGTGKTSILTLRIANILKETQTPASGILAITYTEAGVKAMRKKLREIIGSRSDDIRIHTFHSFAVSVIRDFPDHFPHLFETEPATDIEARNFIEKILQKKEFADLRPFGKPDMYIDPILRTISEAKKEAYTPEMIKSFAVEMIAQIQNDETQISSRGKTKGELKADAKKKIEKCEKTILFADVYDLYEQAKKEAEKIDFDDMIFELQTALKRDELLLRLLQEQYLYLLIDEHQDTNDSQNDLILMIADFFDTPNVFIVGDEKQAIYRFQGASVENFLKFKNIWRDVKLIQLDTNYRSQQKILDAGFRLIENNYEEGEHAELRLELASGKKDAQERPVTIVKTDSITDSEGYMAKKIQEILADDSSEIALIVRTNAAVGRLKRLCESYGIRAASVRNVGIFEHPAGGLFFDLLSAIKNPLDNEALSRTVVAGLWGVSFEEQLSLLKEIRSSGGVKKGALAEKLKILRDSMLSGDPLGFLFEVAETSGYIEKISVEPERVEIWRGIIDFAETILRSRDNFSDTVILIDELISYRNLSEQKQVKVSSGDSDARVKIMTAHGSKGLEFDYVFIPYATESFWMKKSHSSFFVLPFDKPSKDDDVKDSRRLFYVALTRAKKHVEILTHNELENGEMELTLRFIDELGEENIEIENIGKMEFVPYQPRKTGEEKFRASYLEATKRVLTENGLSVTALNHFLTCPNSFLYKSVLKIPELPTVGSEKGNAMHKALAYVFRSGPEFRKGPLEQIEKTIKEKAFEYLDDSFLRKFEIEALKQTLENEIPNIVSGLKDLFTTGGKINVEKSVAGEIEVEISGGAKIKILIHGNLDLVIFGENTLEVFDFKTKKGMTQAEIKGETKNSDGGYFRQLVFYTLLLSQNPDSQGKTINSSLIFLTPDDQGRIRRESLPVSAEDLVSIKENIATLTESVFSGAILDKVCEEEKCQWCALRKISS